VKDERDVVQLAQVVKHTTLMPRVEEGGRPETSVCRSSGLKDATIWQRCSEFFDSTAPRKAIGRGVALASTVYDEALSIEPNGDPYPEHADIVGWPFDAAVPYETNKQLWKIKAQSMAPHFRFVRR
jgi:hypothetical protein